MVQNGQTIESLTRIPDKTDTGTRIERGNQTVPESQKAGLSSVLSKFSTRVELGS
ncbi:13301_t:CDS:2, partial [Gigaspora rosea]